MAPAKPSYAQSSGGRSVPAWRPITLRSTTPDRLRAVCWAVCRCWAARRSTATEALHDHAERQRLSAVPGATIGTARDAGIGHRRPWAADDVDEHRDIGAFGWHVTL